VIRAILHHLGEPPARAPPSGAREPEFVDLGDDVWPELDDEPLDPIHDPT
jgi:hypothetical protein